MSVQSDVNAIIHKFLKHIDKGNLEDALKDFQADAPAAAPQHGIMGVIADLFIKCTLFVEEEEDALLTEARAAPLEGLKDRVTFEKRLHTMAEALTKVKAIQSSFFGKIIELTGKRIHFYFIDQNMSEIHHQLYLAEVLQQTLQDAAFKESWSHLAPDAQKKILKLTIGLLNVMEEVEPVKSQQRISMAKGTLSLLVELFPLVLRLHEVYNSTYEFKNIMKCYYLNFNHEQEARGLVRSCLEGLSKVKEMEIPDKWGGTVPLQKMAILWVANLVSHITSKTRTTLHIADDLRIFFAILNDERFSFMTKSALEFDKYPLWLYEIDSHLFLRYFNRARNFEYRGDWIPVSTILGKIDQFIRCTSCEATHALFDLLEQLPGDAEYPFYLLFQEYYTLPERMAALGPLLVWLSQEIKRDGSDKNKERVSGLLDRMSIFFVESPELADRLLRMPVEKFPVLEQVLCAKENTTDLDTKVVKGVMDQAAETKLAAALFDESFHVKKIEEQFQKLCGDSPDLVRQFHAFLDNVLKIHESPQEATATLQQKLQRLPTNYLKTIDYMLTLVGQHKKSMQEVLVFAAKHPFTKILDRYFITLKSEAINYKEGLVEPLKAMNQLCDEFPGMLRSLLRLPYDIMLKLVVLYKSNRPLAILIIKNYDHLFTAKDIDEMIKDPILQKGIQMILERQREGEIFNSLFQLFKSRLHLLRDGPIVSAILKYPQFVQHLNAHLRGIIGDFDYWGTLPRLLEVNEAEVIRLFELTTGHREAFKQLFPLLAMGQKLELLNWEAGKYPHDLERALVLLDNGHKDLVQELLTLSKTDESLAHRLLDMAHAQYIPEVKELLHLNSYNPGSPLTLKLLRLAGSKHAVIISVVLPLITKEQRLIDLFLMGPLDQIPVPFLRIMTLRVRGEKDLADQTLRLYYSPEIECPVYEIMALQAILDGYFTLARDLLKNKGLPYLQKGDEPPAPHILQKVHELTHDILVMEQGAIKADDAGKLSKLREFALRFSLDAKNEKIISAWVGKVQFLLQHNITRLSQILAIPDWQKVDQKAWDIAADVDAALSALLKEEKDAKLEANDAAAQKATALSLAFARCVMTPSGFINTEVIDHLKRHAALNGLEPYLAEHIVAVLDVLKDPDLNERIQKLKQVPCPSRQRVIIAKFLQLPEGKPLSVRDGRLAILSALLWPLRQNLTGSCFATSQIIRLSSTSNGLKQLLEDLMTLFGKGFVKRRSPEHKHAVKEYPLVCASASEMAQFKYDNPVSRTLEYSLSTLATSNVSILQTRISRMWDAFFEEQIAEGLAAFKGVLKSNHEQLAKAVHKCFVGNLSRSYTMVYNGFARNPVTNETGAWQLVDSLTSEPLKNPGVMQRIFDHTYKSTQEELAKGYEEDSKVIQELFERFLPSAVKSSKYLKVFFQDMLKSKLKGLARVNPAKYFSLVPVSPLEEYMGGNPENVLSNLHENSAHEYFMKASENHLEGILHVFTQLTDDERAQASSNPRLLRNVSDFFHSYNFRIGAAVAAFEKESTASMLSHQERQIAEIERVQLKEQHANEVVKSYLQEYDE